MFLFFLQSTGLERAVRFPNPDVMVMDRTRWVAEISALSQLCCSIISCDNGVAKLGNSAIFPRNRTNAHLDVRLPLVESSTIVSGLGCRGLGNKLGHL